MEDRDAAGVTPTDAALERAIASVPGVVSASVARSTATGRSRLRIRLAAGEDAERVSWAVAATLRERFSIALDPDDIRPREEPGVMYDDPSEDPVHLVRTSGEPPEDEARPATVAPDPSASADHAPSEATERGRDAAADDAARRSETPEARSEQFDTNAREDRAEPSSPLVRVGQIASSRELAETRDRLSSAAREALAGLRERFPARSDHEPGTASGEEIPGRRAESRYTGEHSRPARFELPIEIDPIETPARDGPAPGDTPATDPDQDSGPDLQRDIPAATPTESVRLRRRSHVGREWPLGPAPTDTGSGDDAAAPRPRRLDPALLRRERGDDLAAQLRKRSTDPVPADQQGSRDQARGGDDEETVSRVVIPPVGHLLPAAGPVTGEVVAERAAIRDLDTHRDARDVRVTATLEHGGRAARGEVTTVPTTHGVTRAVAEATLAALGALIGPEFIAGVDRVCLQPTEDPANVLVAVSLVTDRGEETLLGTSVVRGDPERAVMRATLDALNRRVAERFLPVESPTAGSVA